MVKRELDALHELPSLCLVTVSVLWLFPHGAVGASAVFDCDTSRSYSLSFFSTLNSIRLITSFKNKDIKMKTTPYYLNVNSLRHCIHIYIIYSTK